MAKLITLQSSKTYATRENALKAVRKLLECDTLDDNLRFFIHQNEEGRFFPVFIGQSALQAGIHFHFNVVG